MNPLIPWGGLAGLQLPEMTPELFMHNKIQEFFLHKRR